MDDVDRLVDRHAEAIGELLAGKRPMLEEWLVGKPRLVGADLAQKDRTVRVILEKGRALACFEGDAVLERIRARKRTAKRKRQRQRARARQGKA